MLYRDIVNLRWHFRSESFCVSTMRLKRSGNAVGNFPAAHKKFCHHRSRDDPYAVGGVRRGRRFREGKASHVETILLARPVGMGGHPGGSLGAQRCGQNEYPYHYSIRVLTLEGKCLVRLGSMQRMPHTSKNQRTKMSGCKHSDGRLGIVVW